MAPIDTVIGFGTGRFSGEFAGKVYNNAPATISFIFTDAGEPGVNDTASYIVKMGNTIVLNTGDTNGNNVRDVADYNALKANFPPTPAHGSDIPDQLFIDKGNHQAHKEIPPLLRNPATLSLQAQIDSTLDALDSALIAGPGTAVEPARMRA